MDPDNLSTEDQEILAALTHNEDGNRIETPDEDSRESSGDSPEEGQDRQRDDQGRFAASAEDVGDSNAQEAIADALEQADAAPDEEEPKGDKDSDDATALVKDEDGEDGGIRSLSDIAKIFDVEESDFLELIQIQDATGNSHSLQTVLEAWQASPQVEAGRLQLAAQEDAFLAERNQFNAERTDGIQRIRVLADDLITELESDDASELENLRKENPGEYAARMQDRSQKSEKVAAALAEIKLHETNTEQQRQADWDRLVNSEVRELQRKVPALRDPNSETAKTIQSRMAAYYASEGWKPEDIERIPQNQFYIQTMKAMMYDELKGKAGSSRKKVLERPRTVKSQARREVGPERSRQRQRLRRNHEKGGNVASAAALIEDMLED